jgi:shikimate dehydrogenase
VIVAEGGPRAGLLLTGSTRLAGVMGWPVRHSLSPTIMNAAFAAAGLDWVSLAFEVAPEQGGAAIEAMRALRLGGLSVTMPHKAVVRDVVDECTPVAAALGAVNCVYWVDDRLVGDNTDGAGFVDALRVDHGVDVAGLRCVVIGVGGAGRAVIRALADGGASDVVVVNRSRARAERAVALAGTVGRVGGHDDIAGADLVVNATPVGMATGPGARGAEAAGGSAVPFDPDLLGSDQLVSDLVYHPLTTPLLAAATDRGARSVNGLGMLVHQAAHAFRRWTGEDPPLEVMARAALTELDRRAPRTPRTVPDRSSDPSADSTGVHHTMQPDGNDA